MAAETTQIPPSIIAIVAGLVGSILTISFGKVLDLVQKRQEHRYSLQRAFFEKRIEAAEALVGNMRRAISFLEGISVICKRVTDLAITDLSSELLKGQLQILSSQAQTMMQQTKENYYAAPLYFDMEQLDRINSIVYDKILTLCLMMGLIDMMIKRHAARSDNPSKEDSEDIIHKFGELFDGIVVTLESSKDAMAKFVRDLRDEMKEYKP